MQKGLICNRHVNSYKSQTKHHFLHLTQQKNDMKKYREATYVMSTYLYIKAFFRYDLIWWNDSGLLDTLE